MCCMVSFPLMGASTFFSPSVNNCTPKKVTCMASGPQNLRTDYMWSYFNQRNSSLWICKISSSLWRKLLNAPPPTLTLLHPKHLCQDYLPHPSPSLIHWSGQRNGSPYAAAAGEDSLEAFVSAQPLVFISHHSFSRCFIEPELQEGHRDASGGNNEGKTVAVGTGTWYLFQLWISDVCSSVYSLRRVQHSVRDETIGAEVKAAVCCGAVTQTFPE